jgi:SAM-dependent methyltransferase
MALETAAPKNGDHAIEVTGPPEANILWRWMGVRAVPHMPCRFDCADTVALGEQFVQVGRAAGYDQEMDWLLEILSWPVEWSALHGIAEVKTPVLKVSTRTDATASKYVVRRQGDAYPALGAQGLTFPYRIPRRPLLTESRAFQRGLANPLHARPARPTWYASDNGFTSVAAMESAHQPIVEAARAALLDHGGSVLDLGCGNGALLQQIHELNSAVVPFGIDAEAGRIAHARVLLPQFGDHFIPGDMFENDELWSAGRRYALALLMPGRLLEAGPERAMRLAGRLKAHCDHLIVYAYGDWLTRFGDLNGLAREVGLTLLGPSPHAAVSLATFG